MQQMHDMIRLCILTYWITSQTTEPMVIDSQTVTFRDGEQNWQVAYPSSIDSTRKVAINDDTSLAKFFERPVFTTNYTWTPAGPVFFETFDPWSVFFGGARVINRVTNFNLMTAKLHVKFLINGNPFYYGRLMADYHFLPEFDNFTSTVSSFANRVTASQRMHVFLDPTTNMGATMELPFVWPYDTINVPQSEWSKLGRIHLRQMNPLKHANGSTDPIEISISMWATDVQLSIPTVVDSSSLVAQSELIFQSDEYSSTPVSNTATAVSAAAGKLRDVPIIGPYMKATSAVSGMLGNLAKAYGYSRPAMIADPVQMRPELVGAIANTDRGDPVTKLTMDSKQELCIDNSVCGVSTDDELVVSKIATKESYIANFNVPIASVVNTLLWNTRVTPVAPVVNGTGFTLPAATFAALPFKFWRGTVRYRFQIVASAYHKGRLRFVYDPGFISGLEGNVSYTKVVDLADERDFVMDVSWTNEKHFCRVSSPSSTTNSSIAIATAERDLYNGVLGVYILNKVTAPSSLVNNDISINVYMSMCDDVEFAEPSNQYLRFASWIPLAGIPGAMSASVGTVSEVEPADELQFQSEVIQDMDSLEENAPDATNATDAILDCLPVDNTYDVYFGEKITSFRALLKRYNLVETVNVKGVTNRHFRIGRRNFPLYRGVNPSANTSSTTSKFSYNRMTLLNYLAPAFVGIRGALRYKYIFATVAGTGAVVAQLSRANFIGGIEYNGESNINWTLSDSAFAAQFGENANIFNEMWQNSFTGSHLTAPPRNPSMEIELPFYENLRFKDPRNVTQASINTCDASHVLEAIVSSATAGLVHRYVSTGEDFNLFLFQGAPTYYVYENPSPAP